LLTFIHFINLHSLYYKHNVNIKQPQNTQHILTQIKTKKKEN